MTIDYDLMQPTFAERISVRFLPEPIGAAVAAQRFTRMPQNPTLNVKSLTQTRLTKAQTIPSPWQHFNAPEKGPLMEEAQSD